MAEVTFDELYDPAQVGPVSLPNARDTHKAALRGKLSVVATLAAMAALTKASLSDGATVLVQAAGTGGVFRWDASSTATDDGGVVLASDEGGTGRWVRQFDGQVWVDWWGAKGTGDTADAATNATAFQACADYLKELNNGGYARCRAGLQYYIGDEIDCSVDGLFKHVGFEGDGQDPTTLIAYFTGASKALIKGTRADNARAGSPWLRNLKIRVNNDLPGIKPRAFDMRMCEFPQIENVHIVGDYSNTLIEATGVFNGTFRNLELWSGGGFLSRKTVPAGVTFSGTTGTNVINASDNCFDVDDEGTWFAAVDTTGRAGRHLIVTRNSPTQVVVAKNLVENYTDAYGWLEGVRGTIVVGTSATTLVLNADVLTSAHEGLTVVVPTAKDGPEGTTRPLITRIGEVTAPDTCTLVDGADNDVSDVTVYFAPAVAIYDDTQAGGETNDITLDNCRLESHAGIGWLIQGVHLVTSGPAKSHGRARIAEGSYTQAYDDEVAQVSWYLNLVGGQMSQFGFESQAIGEYKVLCEGLVSGLQLMGYRGALIENQKIFRAFGCNTWAKVSVGSGYTVSGVEQANQIGSLFDHDGTITRIDFTGAGPSYYGKRSIDAYGMGGANSIAFSSHRRPIVQTVNSVIQIPLPPNYLYFTNLQRGGKLHLFSGQNIDAFATICYIQDVDGGTASVKIESQTASLFEVGSGVLDGTSETNSKVTVALNGSDSYIQISNRVGTIIWGWHFTAA